MYTGRSGIEVLNGSSLILMGPGSTTPAGGYTRVAYNGNHEIEVNSGYVYLGYQQDVGGFNTIIDGSSGRHIYNATSTSVTADQTYWEGASNCDCYGPVSDDFPLSMDYTSGSGANPATVPSSIVGGEPLVTTGPVHVLSAKRSGWEAAGKPAVLASSGRSAPPEALREEMQAIRRALRAHPYDSENARRIRRLYKLQLLDEENALGAKETNMTLITRWHKKLSDLSSHGELTEKARQAVQAAGERPL